MSHSNDFVEMLTVWGAGMDADASIYQQDTNMTSSKNDGAITRGAHHIGLTVPNLKKTRDFFLNTLRFEQVGEVPDYPAAFVSDGTTMITLWQAHDPVTATPFDRKNVIGLHHLALTVDATVLDSLHDRLNKTADVTIEFAPERLGEMPVRHMMCNIPGGIRVEFLAPDA
jgi:catechol 2,3-dioxygenase-like lactoylglutathione lyase family enzyme